MHLSTVLPKRITARSFLHYLLLISLATATPVFAADPAPEFTLPGRDQPVSLAALRGKVVYVDFWASWCAPCRKSFPWMNSMQKRYGDQGLVIVAVNLDKTHELSDRFLSEVPAELTIAYDPEGKVASAYKVKGMPSSYLIDRTGRIHSSHIGFREETASGMEAAIKDLLQQP
jgi:cytochrome c biogenesis protein CcmG, thiol:disulfide interchange protein DsbE